MSPASSSHERPSAPFRLAALAVIVVAVAPVGAYRDPTLARRLESNTSATAAEVSDPAHAEVDHDGLSASSLLEASATATETVSMGASSSSSLNATASASASVSLTAASLAENEVHRAAIINDVEPASRRHRLKGEAATGQHRGSGKLEAQGHESLLGETTVLLSKGAVLLNQQGGQRQVELDLPDVSGFAVKNKVILAAINMMAWGLCGLDRCYMQQPLAGTLKFLTCGGFGIWAIVDYVVITINCLQSLESIDAVGFQARFQKEDIRLSWWITVILFICQVVAGLLSPKHRLSATDQEMRARRNSSRMKPGQTQAASYASSASGDAEKAFDEFMADSSSPAEPAAAKEAAQPVAKRESTTTAAPPSGSTAPEEVREQTAGPVT